MSGSEGPSASTKIEEQAAHWFAMRDRGDWAAADQAAFEAWLAQSTAHRVAFLRLDAAWSRADRLSALRAHSSAGTTSPPRDLLDAPLQRPFVSEAPVEQETPAEIDHHPPASVAAARRRRAGTIGLTAALTAIAGAVLSLYMRVPEEDIFATPVGATEYVHLQDGSSVTLNTDSKIRVRLAKNERNVYLERGEAMFEVAKDAARPFIVSAGSAAVRAVGTQFAVRQSDSELRVVVTEGRVKFSPGLVPGFSGQRPSPPAGAAALSSSATPIELSAGDIAREASGSLSVSTHADAEAQRLLSWRQGFIAFDNTPLSEAVAEFNRYNKRKIIITDPAISGIRVGGNFQTNNIDGFVWLLARGFPVTAIDTGAQISLQHRD